MEGLTSPLALIDERFMELPRGMDLLVSNKEFKVLLFLEADHELVIEGHPPLSVRSGDLLVQPLRRLQTYRANRKTVPSHIHSLRLILDLPLPKEGGEPSLRQQAKESLRGFIKRHLVGIHHLPQFITPQILGQMARLREETEARRPGYRFEVSQIGLSMIIEVIRRIYPQESSPEEWALTKSAVVINRVKEFLVENLADSLTLDEIAWHVRLSREHLARIFRATTGQTVFEYLTQLRLDAARTHLCNSNLLVTEVARRSGFSSSALFCRTFKGAFHVTPLEYRTQRMEEVRFSPSRYAKAASSRSGSRRNPD